MSTRTLSRQSFNTRLTSVASATTNTKLFGADPTRTGGSVLNSSSAILTIVCSDDDTTAPAALTAGMKTVDIAAGGYFEVPGDWCGAVWGKWASANGSAYLTEYR
jgi:hypothetical protein